MKYAVYTVLVAVDEEHGTGWSVRGVECKNGYHQAISSAVFELPDEVEPVLLPAVWPDA